MAEERKKIGRGQTMGIPSGAPKFGEKTLKNYNKEAPSTMRDTGLSRTISAGSVPDGNGGGKGKGRSDD